MDNDIHSLLNARNMVFKYLVNPLAMRNVDYWSVKNSTNKSLDYKTNLRSEAWINLFTKNKKF